MKCCIPTYNSPWQQVGQTISTDGGPPGIGTNVDINYQGNELPRGLGI